MHQRDYLRNFHPVLIRWVKKKSSQTSILVKRTRYNENWARAMFMLELDVTNTIRHIYLLLSQADPNTVNVHVFPRALTYNAGQVSRLRQQSETYSHLSNPKGMSSLGRGEFSYHRTVGA